MKLAVVFIFISLFACAPIWSVQYFINQDGSGHIHGAWTLIEFLRGNPQISGLFRSNFIFFPDVSGHWLMALMLLFMSAFTTTKVMMTLTYVGTVAAVGWLRWRTVGREGMITSLLIGGAVTFNWLWLEGFYNFYIGFALAVFTIGCYYRWRDEMNLTRATTLALLLFLIFVSHMVSIAVAAGTIVVLCIFPLVDLTKRRVFWSAAAFIPVTLVALIYKLTADPEGGFSPVWRNLQSGHGLSNWLTQLRAVDSFIIISRHSFPFIQTDSTAFAVFTPLIWILLSFVFLFAATWITPLSERSLWRSKYLPFVILAIGSIFVAIVAPDRFQSATSTGGILRERLFLIGLIFLVPLYGTATRPLFGILAKTALIFVIAFQTAALWEYAIRTDRDAREFLSAGTAVPNETSLAAITINPEGLRFSGSPISSLDNYIGIGRDIFVVDNYEFGHYVFPIFLKDRDDQKFALEYTGNNTFQLNDPESYSEQRINKLSDILAAENQRIDTLLVWGSDARIEAAYKPWFQDAPYFENGRVRLYRHK